MKREIIDGKSTDRVPSHYKRGSDDWNKQFNMLLADGDSCMSCVHCQRCSSLFGGSPYNKTCQFYPNKFEARETCKYCGSFLDADGECYKCLREFAISMCG